MLPLDFANIDLVRIRFSDPFLLRGIQLKPDSFFSYA